MRTETQTGAERTHLRGLIAHMTVAMMTRPDERGALVSRPMVPLEMDRDGALWFFTDRRSTKPQHLQTLQLSFVDADRATYVSLSGRGELVVDPARAEWLWTPLARAWFPKGPTSPQMALLKFVPESGEYWDAPHSQMVRIFAIAASVVTGRPVAQGDHARLAGLAGLAARPPLPPARPVHAQG